MPRILVCAALVLFGAGSSHAQWERVQTTWTDEHGLTSRVLHSSPHPLQFYLTPSPERDPTNSLCLGCPLTDNGQRRNLKDYVVDVSQRPLGKAFRRQIIEIVLSLRDTPEIKRLYIEQAARENRVLNIDPDSSDEAPDIQWKSIVMESSPHKYQELSLLIDTGWFVRQLSEASLFAVQGAQILGTTEYLKGNAFICAQSYWVLGTAGPRLIDFGDVEKEIKKVVPPNGREVGCWTVSREELEVTNWVKGDCGACDLGTAVVRFRLDGHRAIPVSSSFQPFQPGQDK